MAEIQIKQGNIIFEKGTPLSTLCLIEEGEVLLSMPVGEIILKAGDAIGFFDLLTGIHSYDYIAQTDVVVDFIPFKHLDHFCEMLKNDTTIAQAFLLACNCHITHFWDTYTFAKYECDSLYSALMQFYKDYHLFCNQFDIVPKSLPGFEDVHPLSLDQDLENYIGHYYKDMNQLFQQSSFPDIFSLTGFISGFLIRACQDMHMMIDANLEMNEYITFLSTFFINEDRLDFLDMFSSLYGTAMQKRADLEPIGAAISKLFIRANGVSSIAGELYESRKLEFHAYQQRLEEDFEKIEAQLLEKDQEEQTKLTLQDSFLQILDFAQAPTSLRTRMLENLSAYKNEPDKTGSTPALLELRTNLTQDFFELYLRAFLFSMKAPIIPPVVKLFFYYGYLDETLCGYQNATDLLQKNMFFSATKDNIYPFYDWLTLIFKGEKQPHKDEFDRDYPTYIKSLESDGTISGEEAEKRRNNPIEKVKFEIRNLMVNGMKMTSGHPATYCPVLSEHNFIKAPNACMLHPNYIDQALQKLLEIDFSAYHREIMFHDDMLGKTQHPIDKQVLPQFILMPCIGTRGALWQEIEGFNRQSPASMLLPIFCLTDLNLLILRLTGEFRWEMCKRMQGARWNDFTYPSLTSEYADYLQFYKNNNDLSPESKQKCKQQLIRVRNRYKESFLLDYMSWVTYESKGSTRLNKVTRQIFINYCPFPINVRNELMKNPMFAKPLERYQNHKNKELTRIHSVIFKVKRNNRDNCPQPLLDQAEFLKL